jgi:hypothetical protein
VKVAIIGEGQTEYYCLPKIAGRLGNQIVGKMHIRGGANPQCKWEMIIEKKVIPAILVMSVYLPDRIVVVLDREDRDQCPVDLANKAMQMINSRCSHLLEDRGVSLIVSDKDFESVLFADYCVVDQLPILKKAVSATFPLFTDGRRVIHWLDPGLRKAHPYEKIRDGMFLAQKMDLGDDNVLGIRPEDPGYILRWLPYLRTMLKG